MNAVAKVILNALMIVAVVSPFASVAFSSPAAEAASPRTSGKPGRLEPGGSRAVPQNSP